MHKLLSCNLFSSSVGNLGKPVLLFVWVSVSRVRDFSDSLLRSGHCHDILPAMRGGKQGCAGRRGRAGR